MTSFITKKSILALSVAAALGMSVAGPAHAAGGAEAYANLNILNLKVFDVTGGGSTQITTANSGGYFSNLSATNTATNTAVSPNIPPLVAVEAATDNAGGPINALQACLGACVGENTFTQTATGATNFERADSQLLGSLLSAGGANVNAVAESQLLVNGPAQGQSNSQVGTNSGFTFTAATDTQIQFTFDSTGSLVAQLLAGSAVPPSTARAAASYSITLQDTTAGGPAEFIYAPPTLNTSVSLPPPDAGTSNAALAGIGFATPVAGLTQGHNYTVTINHTVSQNESFDTAVPAVPEPATLALLGTGLLGFGAVRRFRKA